MANNTVHTITLSGYTATTEGNCWALQLGTWDSYGIEQIQLALAPEWDGLVITATFTPPKGRKAVKVVVDSSGLFDVPQEATALSGQGAITFAGNTSGQQRISVDVPYVVANHAAVDGVTPDPTPSEWEQFVAQVQQARDDAEAAVQAAEGSQTAAAGSASAAAESAQEAQNIVDGAVQDITDAKNAAVQAVNDAGNTAVQAVQTAQTTAVGAVNDAGDAKIEQIEQINALVPTPTPEDAGKAVVVKLDGTGYELGDAGSEIDDTVVAPDTTWSSLNIVNKLCPPFSVTGDTVQFNPVEGYPLSVQSTIVATQEGTGDPSPTNVRPIVPVDEVSAWVGGKNLADPAQKTQTANNIYYGAEGFDGILLKAGASYTLSLNSGTSATGLYINDKATNQNLAVAYNKTSLSFTPDADVVVILMAYFNGGVPSNVTAFQLELGTTPSNYEPYYGKFYAASLPEPCYGGEIDLTEGTGKATAKAVTFDGSESGWGNPNVQSNGVYYITAPVESVPNAGASAAIACSSRTLTTMAAGNIPAGCVKTSGGAVYYSSEKSTKAEILAEMQESPFTLVFSAESPTPFTIDPLSIPAPASPATAYSTAGEITVAGRSDPTALIQQMQEQIAALQSATIGG